MPSFGIRSQKHSNRSQQALNTTVDSRPSSQDDLPPANASAGLHSNSSSTDIQAYLNNRAQTQEFDTPQIYTHNNVSRNQLQQHSKPAPSQAPPRYAAAQEKALESERPSLRKAAQAVLVEQKKSKTRNFFGLGSSKPRLAPEQAIPATTVSSSQQSSPPQGNQSPLGRRVSKRSKDQPSVRTSFHQDPSDQQQYLPSPREEESADLDPYRIRDFANQHFQTTGSNPVTKASVRLLPGHQIPPVDTNVSSHNLQPPQYHSNTPSSPNPSGLPQYNTAKYKNPQQATSPNTFSIPRLVHPPNSDAVSQTSHDGPVESDFRSSPVRHTGQIPDCGKQSPSHTGELPPRTSSLEPTHQSSQPSSPAMTNPPNRQTGDAKPTYQTDGREVPPNYKQKFSGQGQTLQAPQAGGAQSSYRGGPPQRESFGGGERGRDTPPPSADQPDVYKELLQKYKKVKGLYFEKTAQVEQLQNTIANQRLSHSRTALDDNEYSTRFNRLDGAINNLAFNIRKDWISIPSWLCPYVNLDAQKVGTKEMTAVGRACISRWLTDEIFHRTFHPGLEPNLSASLKIIESNIRKNSPPPNNQEESESLTTKVVHWRLATLDGLSNLLNSPESTEFKEHFTLMAVSDLTASLMSHLQDPPPAGLEGSATMIVELAVGIAANLPLESRDISVIYPMPNDTVRHSYMKIEPPLPALDNPGQAEAENEESSVSSGSKDNLMAAAGEGQAEGSSAMGAVGKIKEKTRNSVLAGLMGSKKAQSTASIEPAMATTPVAKVDKEAGRELVRFAGFVGVEVIGRSMLVKAPIWTIS